MIHSNTLRQALWIVVLGTTLILSACAAQAGSQPASDLTAEPTEPQSSDTPVAVSHGGEVQDYVSLVDALRAADAIVEPQDTVEQPFFSVEGQILLVNGESVQVFEFESEDAAKESAATIDPDGYAIGTSMVDWVATPHFYQKGKLIVLYVGDKTEVTDLLEASLGAQIAGGTAPATTEPTGVATDESSTSGDVADYASLVEPVHSTHRQRRWFYGFK